MTGNKKDYSESLQPAERGLSKKSDKVDMLSLADRCENAYNRVYCSEVNPGGKRSGVFWSEGSFFKKILIY